ncbi:MAG: septum formation initiator family protein [Patescibacteria group bacterium]|jgi:cell division protein FtsB
MKNLRALLPTRSEAMPWLLGLFLVALLVGNTRLLIRRQQIKTEVAELNEKATELQRSNQQLQSLLSYVQTDTYTEEQARVRFNLAKPGEKLFILPQEGEELAAGGEEPATESGSLIAKWWRFFFVKQ